MIVRIHITLLFCLFAFGLYAQNDTIVNKRITIDGEIVIARVENGDTLIIAELDEASVTSFRNFDSDTQYRRYMKYRRYANIVYPYAVESIKMFRKVERDTEEMKKRKRKKYVRNLQKDLKKEFTDPLKSLSRTQGKILIKMIEYELDTPMFVLLRNVKSRFSAAKWQTFGKLYGYDLKEGYIPGDDPIMDAILQDFDISYE
jgi:uncharacterized protein DUF4294